VEDIRAYIESGILELYVLGDVTREEKFEVEAMAAKHPSVRAELDEIERSMESYAKVNAVEPAETQRERILNSLLTNLADDRNFESKQREKPGAVVIPLQTSREVVAYKYAFAACFVLLVVSVAALINAYRQIDQSNTLIVSLQSQNQAIAKTASFRENELNVFRDSSFKLVKLSGTKKSPASKLMVAFSPLKKKVMIDMANTNMPVNDKAHQYQLWAMVGGKPVNLGVFDADTTSKEMVEMKSIASANAFAVTLEPRGGSASPTMSEMMVLGKF
jgi:anti-sigma-K factor RskA